jgi:hypothetical protein
LASERNFRRGEIIMTGKAPSLGHKDIEALILRALVRKLIAKQVLSVDDVRALLLDAVEDLDDFGGRLRPEAAHRMVEEDLAPAFLGS